jgi:hypothetical protein
VCLGVWARCGSRGAGGGGHPPAAPGPERNVAQGAQREWHVKQRACCGDWRQQLGRANLRYYDAAGRSGAAAGWGAPEKLQRRNSATPRHAARKPAQGRPAGQSCLAPPSKRSSPSEAMQCRVQRTGHSWQPAGGCTDAGQPAGFTARRANTHVAAIGDSSWVEPICGTMMPPVDLGPLLGGGCRKNSSAATAPHLGTRPASRHKASRRARAAWRHPASAAARAKQCNAECNTQVEPHTAGS